MPVQEAIQLPEFDIWDSTGTPHCNTGVQIAGKSGFLLHPDWVTLIFPDANKYLSRGVDDFIDLWRFSRLMEFVPSCKLPTKKGLHNYENGIYCYTQSCGSLLWSLCYGGNNNTVRLELTGKGCGYISKVHGWWALYRLARRGSAYISRFDLAGNDYLGQYVNPRKARRDYAARYKEILPSLEKGNRVPKASVHDTEKGYTASFGTENMIVNHVCYEKGKEAKGSFTARQYPDWVRWETRWKRRKNGYEIDRAIMRPDNWAAAYFGACPYMADTLGYKGSVAGFTGRLVKEIERDLALRLVKTLAVIREQYGATLTSAYSLMGADLFLPQLLRGEGHMLYRTLKQEDLFHVLGRVKK